MGYGIKDILHNKARQLLHLETEPGLGCTEPAAIGLAAAAAAALLGGARIDAIAVETDPNSTKNAMGVIIPNAGGGAGIALAAAMGALAGDASRGLQVFATVDGDGLDRATALLAAGGVRTQIAEQADGLYVKVSVDAAGRRAEAVIAGAHDSIVSLTLDNEARPLSRATGSAPGGNHEREALKQWLVGLTLAELVGILDDLDADDLAFIKHGLTLNEALVEHGLTHAPGLGVGRTKLALIRQGLLKKDMALWAALRAAAGIDSRMGGVPLPAMTLAGSGNQGIAAGIPVAAAAHFATLEDESVVLRAVTLSYLVTCSIKAGAGLLSALCGSGVAGGAGVAAGCAYLFGGALESIGGALKNHIENSAAVLCDGAKTSCALKVGELAGSGVTSALLALHGCIVHPIDGIIDRSPDATMRNLGLIARQGLRGADPVILDIMRSKQA